jgi:hypothetical protein
LAKSSLWLIAILRKLKKKKEEKRNSAFTCYSWDHGVIASHVT